MSINQFTREEILRVLQLPASADKSKDSPTAYRVQVYDNATGRALGTVYYDQGRIARFDQDYDDIYTGPNVIVGVSDPEVSHYIGINISGIGNPTLVGYLYLADFNGSVGTFDPDDTFEIRITITENDVVLRDFTLFDVRSNFTLPSLNWERGRLKIHAKGQGLEGYKVLELNAVYDLSVVLATQDLGGFTYPPL